MRTLLACGFDLSIVDERGRKLWIQAMAGRFLGVIGALLADYGVDVYYLWLFGGFMSLYLVVWNGYAGVVQLLLAPLE